MVRAIEDAEHILEALDAATNLGQRRQTSRTRTVYLDLVVFKVCRFSTEKQVDMKPYLKLTQKKMYLPAQNNKPSYLRKGAPRGEGIQLLKKSSSKEDRLESQSVVSKSLLVCGWLKGKFKPQY